MSRPFRATQVSSSRNVPYHVPRGSKNQSGMSVVSTTRTSSTVVSSGSWNQILRSPFRDSQTIRRPNHTSSRLGASSGESAINSSAMRRCRRAGSLRSFLARWYGLLRTRLYVTLSPRCDRFDQCVEPWIGASPPKSVRDGQSRAGQRIQQLKGDSPRSDGNRMPGEGSGLGHLCASPKVTEGLVMHPSDGPGAKGDATGLLLGRACIALWADPSQHGRLLPEVSRVRREFPRRLTRSAPHKASALRRSVPAACRGTGTRSHGCCSGTPPRPSRPVDA